MVLRCCLEKYIFLKALIGPCYSKERWCSFLCVCSISEILEIVLNTLFKTSVTVSVALSIFCTNTWLLFSISTELNLFVFTWQLVCWPMLKKRSLSIFWPYFILTFKRQPAIVCYKLNINCRYFYIQTIKCWLSASVIIWMFVSQK